MHAYQQERLQEKRAGSLLDELHHIHRELVRLLPVVVKSTKTDEWNTLLRQQQRADDHLRARLVEVAGLMGRKPRVCECPKAVELLADVLLAHRSLLRKHASGGLVIQALRTLRVYTGELWDEFAHMLAFLGPEAARILVDQLREAAHTLIWELPAINGSQLSAGGLRSLNH